jgi:hypothetical protein
MYNDRSTSMYHLGRAGEVIFGNYMSRQGKIVEYSIDQYDDKRDMKIDGLSYEVKTQVPFVIENAFTVKENQLRKLKAADYTVFVSVPLKTSNHWSAGKVYIIPGSDVGNIVRRRQTRDGRQMILLPIREMTELFTIADDHAMILQQYSISEWN